MKKFIPKTLYIKKSCITNQMRKDKNYYFEEASPISVYAYGLNKKAEEKLKEYSKNKSCSKRK